ncbi:MULTISPECIES: YwgA family protein [Rossellomorea]|uniref:YwgA family protein n=1 Tax=Rossellomorea aquimaris TaxID=189382 RepID=A0A5D4UDS1_9BACI|nr:MULTISPECIES: YwgA family protein [Rossellomorea]MDT9026694.1 YwgA family protein [Rossellomorea sp. YC4-1]TYS76230.1 YwgA family protein [Rossellomorea aquimaris]TYS82665.1 YwgA family protein [Rossellomorea aquimaris]TYS85128.1 YwgA family protein [Rossellomorea aquimaris]
MLKDHAKLMSAFLASGEVVGRKKLQKMIFIAKKLEFPFQEKFQFHFYGPYSEELTLRVEELCNMGFISEVKEKKGGYYQYRYTVTKEGEDFLQIYEKEMPCLEDCLTDMNVQSARFLELVSTVLYFDNLPKDEVVEKVFTLKSKQKYTEEEIDEAFAYIEGLKLKKIVQ